MTSIREIGLVIAFAGMLTALLSAYFDWRAKWFDNIRRERSR